MEEFYAQADLEKERGLMNTVPLRGSCKMGKFQLGFLGFIRPLFAKINQIPNIGFDAPVDGIDAVRAYWIAENDTPADTLKLPPLATSASAPL